MPRRARGVAAALLAVLCLLLVPAASGDPAAVAAAGPGIDGVVSRDGVDLHYTLFGADGPLVVLLTGGPGIAGDYFLPLARRLSEGARAVVLDQRGTGRSHLAELGADDLSLELVVEDLEALRAQLGAERWVLLGHSWGGMLAMLYAAEHPEHVSGLVLAGSGGPDLTFLTWYRDNIEARLDPHLRDMVGWWLHADQVAADAERALEEYARLMAPAMTFDPQDVVPLVSSFVGDGALEPRVNLVLMGEWAERGLDLTPRLGRVESPVLVIQGRQDPVGESTAYQIRDAFPDAHLEWFERCGHLPFVEHEDRFVASVQDFLDRLGEP